MRVVSYYTPSYRSESDRLVSSLRRLGLRYTLTGVADQGGWDANTQLKPLFLRRMLETSGEPVLWLDADAVVWEDPEFFHCLEEEEEPPDLSCFYGKTPAGREVLLSGTLWLNPGPATFQVLERWIEANAAAPREWDQVNLQRVLARSDCDAVVRRFGPEYCYVFDVHPPSYGLEGVRPVIEHFQASRRLAGAERGASSGFTCAQARRRLDAPPARGSRPLCRHPDLPDDLSEVFVVGGGASLRDFDWRRLDFRFTIAVNRAWELLPSASLCFTASERFYSWVCVDRRWQSHPGLKVVLDRDGWPYGEGVWTVLPAATGERPGDVEGGIVDTGSSGHSAVDLALALGAREVVLVGFDLAPGRWHPGYPWPDREVDWQRRRQELERLVRAAEPGRIRHLDERGDAGA